jgi:DNA-binding response OmpR family regulator
MLIQHHTGAARDAHLTYFIKSSIFDVRLRLKDAGYKGSLRAILNLPTLGLIIGEASLAGERILVVDDGADMRDFVIKYVLQPNGFEYLEARDGLEGFEQIVSGSPDLVLMDLQMPRLDGIGLLRKMQENDVNIPVVLMTFYGSEEIAIEVFRLGVKDYVMKPFTEEELLEAIERSLMVTRLRREREELTERLAAASREFQRRVRELQGLYRVGKVIASQPDADTLMLRILEAATFLAGAESSGLLLLDDEGRSLVRRAVKAGREVP